MYCEQIFKKSCFLLLMLRIVPTGRGNKKSHGLSYITIPLFTVAFVMFYSLWLLKTRITIVSLRVRNYTLYICFPSLILSIRNKSHHHTLMQSGIHYRLPPLHVFYIVILEVNSRWLFINFIHSIPQRLTRYKTNP